MQSTLHHCIESVTAGSCIQARRHTIITRVPKVSWLQCALDSIVARCIGYPVNVESADVAVTEIFTSEQLRLFFPIDYCPLLLQGQLHYCTINCPTLQRVIRSPPSAECISTVAQCASARTFHFNTRRGSPNEDS